MPDSSVADEIAAAENPDAAPHRMLAAVRRRVEHRPWLRRTYRALVAVLGVGIILTGIALLVLPGPGWLVIFLGLGVLGTEFPAARRLTDRLKAVVLRAWHWWRDRRGRSSSPRA
ncbi:MAG TPA: PGPGW domain-containing protein [Cellulomonas sp.]